MSRAACKAAIDGQYLVVTSGLAGDNEEIAEVFESRGGSRIVFEISALCSQLADMVNAALRPEGDGGDD